MRLWTNTQKKQPKNRGAHRPTKRLIEAPTKKTLEYWSGLRKATGSILMQLRTGKIGLGGALGNFAGERVVVKLFERKCNLVLGKSTTNDRAVTNRLDRLAKCHPCHENYG
jgi:hypothetical protein